MKDKVKTEAEWGKVNIVEWKKKKNEARMNQRGKKDDDVEIDKNIKS